MGINRTTAYYDPLNNTVKSYYKNTFNFRLGGEYKVDELAFRMGGSYSMNPYTVPQIESQSEPRLAEAWDTGNTEFSLTSLMWKPYHHDVNFPYRLSEKDNVYSTVNTVCRKYHSHVSELNFSI